MNNSKEGSGDSPGKDNDGRVARKLSPGVPPGLRVFTSSRALQRSMEALNMLRKDKEGWPPLNNLEAEEHAGSRNPPRAALTETNK